MNEQYVNPKAPSQKEFDELADHLAKFKTTSYNVTTNSGGSAQLGLSSSKMIIGARVVPDGHIRLDEYSGYWWAADLTASTNYTVYVMYWDD